MSSASFSRALIATLAVACSSPPRPAPPPPPADPEPAVEAPVEPPDDGIPATAAGARLRWFLKVLNNEHAVPGAVVYAKIFTPGFVAKVPHATFAQLSTQLRAAAPYRLAAIKDGATATSLVAVTEVKGGKLAIHIRVTGSDNRIDGLLVRPEVEVAPVKSWEDLSTRLAAAGKSAQYLAARIDKRRCVEISSHQADRPLAIGSAFKLYVLYALHQQIAAGKLSWDQKLAIRDEHKSLPSGTMQTLAAGTEKSLQEFALQMISISDNTATDHLLFKVGRERVERAMRAARHSAPKLNRPFLGTREMFALKLGIEEAARERYLAMSARKKRAYLKELSAVTIPLSRAGAWTAPLAIDVIEWFASGRDLCNVMAALKLAADGSPELREVLGKNPGVAIDDKVWTYVGFKGGSEPGVMNLTWLLRHAGGDWYVFAMTVNDTTRALDENALAGLGQAALAFFGDQVAAKP